VNVQRIVGAKQMQNRLLWMQTGDGLIPLMDTRTATLVHLGIKQFVQTMTLVQENVPLTVLTKMICLTLMVLQQMEIHLT